MSGECSYPQDATVPQYSVVEVTMLTDAEGDAHFLNKRGVVTGAVFHCEDCLYEVHFFELPGAPQEHFWAEELTLIATPFLADDRGALGVLLLACQGLLDSMNSLHLAAARVDARKALAQLNHTETTR